MKAGTVDLERSWNFLPIASYKHFVILKYNHPIFSWLPILYVHLYSFEWIFPFLMDLHWLLYQVHTGFPLVLWHMNAVAVQQKWQLISTVNYSHQFKRNFFSKMDRIMEWIRLFKLVFSAACWSQFCSEWEGHSVCLKNFHVEFEDGKETNCFQAQNKSCLVPLSSYRLLSSWFYVYIHIYRIRSIWKVKSDIVTIVSFILII